MKFAIVFVAVIAFANATPAEQPEEGRFSFPIHFPFLAGPFPFPQTFPPDAPEAVGIPSFERVEHELDGLKTLLSTTISLLEGISTKLSSPMKPHDTASASPVSQVSESLIQPEPVPSTSSEPTHSVSPKPVDLISPEPEFPVPSEPEPPIFPEITSVNLSAPASQVSLMAIPNAEVPASPISPETGSPISSLPTSPVATEPASPVLPELTTPHSSVPASPVLLEPASSISPEIVASNSSVPASPISSASTSTIKPSPASAIAPAPISPSSLREQLGRIRRQIKRLSRRL